MGARVSDGLSRIVEVMRSLTADYRRYAHHYRAPDGWIDGQWLPIKDEAALEFVGPIAWQPTIRRLFDIAQLGTAAQGTYPLATHTRWTHVVGVASTAGACIASIERSGTAVPPEWKQATLLAALLHDSMQGPWGHSLEFASDLFDFQQGAMDGRLDKVLLRHALQNPHSDVRLALEAVFSKEKGGALDRDGLDDLVQKVIAVSTPSVCIEEHPDFFFLAQLLDGEIDADRLDYIPRDFKFTINETDVERSLLQDARDIVQGLSVCSVEFKGRSVRVLTFDWSTRGAMKRLLVRRSESYADIYENPPKVAADEMLAHALVYLLREADYFELLDGAGSSPINYTVAVSKRREVAELLGLLTDDAFIAMFSIVGGAPGAGSLAKWAQHLCSYVKNGQAFIPIDVQIIGYSEKDEMVSQLDDIKDIVNAKRSDWQSVLADQQSGLGQRGMLMAFARLVDNYGLKLRAERALWSRLWKREGFPEIVADYLSVVGIDIDVDSFVNVPLIHISRPWHELSAAAPLNKTDPSSDRKGKRDGHPTPTYRFRAADGACIDQPVIEVGKSIWLPFVSCPRWLKDNQEAAAAIREEWEAFVADGPVAWRIES